MLASPVLVFCLYNISTGVAFFTLFHVEPKNKTPVTTIEIIIPQTKVLPHLTALYIGRRYQLLEQNINIVEIDLTRSEDRLFGHRAAFWHPYQVTVYLPGDNPYLIGMEFDKPLKQIAVPLQKAVIPLSLQAAYEYGYGLPIIPAHIERDNKYKDSDLPFPSLLTDEQRQQALETVETWKTELARLAKEA